MVRPRIRRRGERRWRGPRRAAGIGGPAEQQAIVRDVLAVLFINTQESAANK